VLTLTMQKVHCFCPIRMPRASVQVDMHLGVFKRSPVSRTSPGLSSSKRTSIGSASRFIISHYLSGRARVKMADPNASCTFRFSTVSPSECSAGRSPRLDS
jgi:hypothetical protein